MKAITLHQPWASLVAMGVKTIETRSWATKYRGPLAIHAGARQVHTGNFLMLARTALSAGLIDAETEAHFRALDVPFGAVVATCTLVDCVPMIDALRPTPEGPDGPLVLLNGLNRHLWLYDTEPHNIEDQRPYGDFAPGRWAWLLSDVKPIDPVPARGYQRVWTWSGQEPTRTESTNE